MAKAIHTMVRVLEEAKSVDFYNKAFALDVEDRFEFDGFTLVYLKNKENDFEVELTVNHGQLGLSPTPVKEFHRDGALMAKFFFVQDPDGYKIEVLQRHGRYT